MYKQERYLFRAATEEDIRELAAIEKICFSENEACSYEDMKDRVEKIPEDFLIAFDQVNRKIAGCMSFLQMLPCRKKEQSIAFF